MSNRLEDRWAACKTGRYALVSSWFPHFGEEDCLRGWNGSGTIFFTHCNLRCVFCQNYDISQDVRPPYRTGTSGSLEQPGVPPHDLARMMLELQARGCPAGKVGRASYAEINRRLTSAEFREANRIAAVLGLRRIDERRPHARLLRRMV